MFHQDGKKMYEYKCDCGKQRTTSSKHVTRLVTCPNCSAQKLHDSHKGEKHGRMTCLGYSPVKKGHGYLIQCECGKRYTINDYKQFLITSSCKSCSKGVYPGKKSGLITFIKNMHNRSWKMECECGTVFIGATRRRDCGCVAKKKILDLAQTKVGRKYHYLTVKEIHSHEDGHIKLLVKCKCGNQFIRHNGHEFKGRSCGCEFVVPVGEKASKAILKNYEVISMRELHDSGLYSIQQLSTMFKKKEHYIWRIVNRKIWKHV